MVRPAVLQGGEWFGVDFFFFWLRLDGAEVSGHAQGTWERHPSARVGIFSPSPPAWGGLAGTPLPREGICGERNWFALANREEMPVVCWIQAHRDREGTPLTPSLPRFLRRWQQRRTSPGSSSRVSRELHAKLLVSGFPELTICPQPPPSRGTTRCGVVRRFLASPAPSLAWGAGAGTQIPQGR